MSDNVVNSLSDGDNSVNPYQSVWMSHWKHNSCNKSVNRPCTRVITSYDSRKDGYGTKKHLLVCEPELGINIPEQFRVANPNKDRVATMSHGGSSSMCFTVANGRDEAITLGIYPEKRRSSANLLDNSLVFSNSFPKHRKKALLLPDPSSSKNQKPDNLQNHTDFRLFESQNHSKAARWSKLLEPNRGASKISMTLITMKTEVNFSEEAQMLRESTLTAKLKGEYLSALFSESTDFSIHKQKAKLLSLLDNEESGNTKDIGTSDKVYHSNESSAETDYLDLDPFQENYVAGLASPPPDNAKDDHIKDSEMNRKAQFHDSSALAGAFSDAKLNRKLPVINKHLPDFPIRETSTSKTRSLDLEHQFPHAQHLTNSSSSNRWVKRLKYSASNSAYGSTNSNKEAAISDKKDDQKREILLSNPWIERWCSNRTAMSVKKLEPVVIYEPECSKMAVNDCERKQFPSIAAMALMGKAMNGFRPCELKKKGSYLVWNTDGF